MAIVNLGTYSRQTAPDRKSIFVVLEEDTTQERREYEEPHLPLATTPSEALAGRTLADLWPLARVLSQEEQEIIRLLYGASGVLSAIDTDIANVQASTLSAGVKTILTNILTRQKRFVLVLAKHLRDM